MSRTLHFGRDILDAPDIDIEELLGLLSPKDIQSLVDEMAADPGALSKMNFKLKIVLLKHFYLQMTNTCLLRSEQLTGLL